MSSIESAESTNPFTESNYWEINRSEADIDLEVFGQKHYNYLSERTNLLGSLYGTKVRVLGKSDGVLECTGYSKITANNKSEFTFVDYGDIQAIWEITYNKSSLSNSSKTLKDFSIKPLYFTRVTEETNPTSDISVFYERQYYPDPQLIDDILFNKYVFDPGSREVISSLGKGDLLLMIDPGEAKGTYRWTYFGEGKQFEHNVRLSPCPQGGTDFITSALKQLK